MEIERESSEQKKLVLVFFGSPSKSGTTAKLLNEFLNPLKENMRIETVNAYERNIAPCIACNVCAGEERCSQPDFDGIDALIREADVIVVATPVYNLSLPAPLKAIADRTQRYFAARFSLGIRNPVKKHKQAAALITCGSKDCEGAEIIARQLKLMFSVMNTSLTGTAVWTGTDFEAGSETFETARNSARELALAIACEL
ncbi:flavodoxin family protein [Caproiciproducens faecalis]|uniref:Flavodoxin family protein n=1 Tax=Caproiciproducens faecalis TaxID=2820301 RepID=A0ABS7DR54_9FIRM|nr:flavodoxin family protein [Caproiciproducens faecalis]MBW7573784.1 flavodoxin family protein [Caproiciproducens faecalis]